MFAKLPTPDNIVCRLEDVGWEIDFKGENHFVLVKGEKTVIVPKKNEFSNIDELDRILKVTGLKLK